jgi:Methyltransferase domain
MNIRERTSSGRICPQFSLTSIRLSTIPFSTYTDSVPVNCSFEIDDAEDEWIFSHNFDYIHARGLVTCFRDPRQVLASAISFLEPGGYLEIQDAIFPPKYFEAPEEGALFPSWIETVMKTAANAGRPWTNVQYYAQWMQEIGLIDVVDRRFFLPAGLWPEGERNKKLGVIHLQNYLAFVEGITPKSYAAEGWTDDEIQILIAQVKNELKDGTVKIYNEMVSVWGRRPPAPAPTPTGDVS